jgi:hypothetical protein
MSTLKASAVHLKFSMEQKGVSEFSLGTSESEVDERYLFSRLKVESVRR